MAKFAGLEEVITVLLGDLTRTLPKLKEPVNFLLLDHAKDMYVPDLESAVKEGILKQAFVVVADNIIIPGAPAYNKYMEEESKKYLSTFLQVGKDAIIISTLN